MPVCKSDDNCIELAATGFMVQNKLGEAPHPIKKNTTSCNHRITVAALQKCVCANDILFISNELYLNQRKAGYSYRHRLFKQHKWYIKRAAACLY